MQTTEGYALRTRVIRGSQHMFSMKKKNNNNNKIFQSHGSQSYAALQPLATHLPPPAPSSNMSTYPRIHLSNGVCSKVAEHFWVYKPPSQWWANLTPIFYLSAHDTLPPSTSPLSPSTPDLKAGQGTSHCSFQLPGTLVEEKEIQKADSTIKAIWKLLLYYALLWIGLLERTLSKLSQCSMKLWRFDHD